MNAGRAGVRAGSVTYRSPSISRNSTPHVVSSISARVSRARWIRTFTSVKVSNRESMILDSQCIVAQLPPQIPRKRLMPTTSGLSQALISNSRVRAVAFSVSRSMERSAPLATALKFFPSRASSLAAASSIRCRSASSLLLSREVKSFGLEVSFIQFSLQPPPLAAGGIAGGDVVLSLARHLQPHVLQRGDHVGAALYRAVLDALHEVVADQRARVRLVFESGPQSRCLDVGHVARPLRPGARRVVRTAPAVLVVEGVAKRGEGLLPAGGRDVQAPARLEVALRGEDVRVDAAPALAVEDRRPRVAVRLQPRPGRLLELVEDGFDLLAGRPVLRRPRDHGGRVPALEVERVGEGGHHVRVPAHDFDALALLSRRVTLADEILDRRAGRALPVGEELNEHRRPPRRCGRHGAASSRRRRGG